MTKRSADTDSSAVQEAANTHKRRKMGSLKPAAVEYPVPPAVISSFAKPRNVTNHSYKDFSKVPPRMQHPTELPSDVESMSFPQKLHHLLNHPAYARWVEWMPHGRAFRLKNPLWLEQADVYLNVFQCRRYAVFLALLNSYGFKQITRGTDRNCFYHELFLRNLPHLTYYFEAPKDARRLRPDPASEPDFYSITEKFPIPS